MISRMARPLWWKPSSHLPGFSFLRFCHDYFTAFHLHLLPINCLPLMTWKSDDSEGRKLPAKVTLVRGGARRTPQRSPLARVQAPWLSLCLTPVGECPPSVMSPGPFAVCLPRHPLGNVLHRSEFKPSWTGILESSVTVTLSHTNVISTTHTLVFLSPIGSVLKSFLAEHTPGHDTRLSPKIVRLFVKKTCFIGVMLETKC